jgi:putative superfamily III holin-X
MAADESNLGSERGAARPKTDRSMAGLLADLADQIGSLFRQEVALLKAELQEKLGLIGQGVGAVAIGALMVFSGWLALLAAAVLGLAVVVAPWLAALIVGLVVLGLGGALLYFGKSRLDARSLAMRRTLGSLRENEAWIRERVS